VLESTAIETPAYAVTPSTTLTVGWGQPFPHTSPLQSFCQIALMRLALAPILPTSGPRRANPFSTVLEVSRLGAARRVQDGLIPQLIKVIEHITHLCAARRLLRQAAPNSIESSNFCSAGDNGGANIGLISTACCNSTADRNTPNAAHMQGNCSGVPSACYSLALARHYPRHPDGDAMEPVRCQPLRPFMGTRIPSIQPYLRRFPHQVLSGTRPACRSIANCSHHTASRR